MHAWELVCFKPFAFLTGTFQGLCIRACRDGALMLATLMVGVLSKAYAITLNTTTDGLSVGGIFFAKLENLHAKHMSGEIGKVRL
jgi:hypothetical protein